VLVVDRHALQPVDLLDLIDQELGSASMPWMRRISCGSGLPSIRYSPLRITSPSWTAMCFALGDQELDRVTPIFRGDLDAALVLVVPSELDTAVHLGDDRAILGPGALRTAPPPAADRR